MSLPNIQNLSLDTEATQRTTVAPKSNPSNEHAVTDGYAHDEKDAFGVSTAAVVKYLMAKSLIYRKLQRLREEVSKLPGGLLTPASHQQEMASLTFTTPRDGKIQEAMSTSPSSAER